MVKKEILIVEDERIVAEDIKNSLQNIGYTIIGIASSGEEAIEKVRKGHPGLVMMDITLNGDMDGIECASHILSHTDVPIVYLTAHADERTLERAKITEPFGYIVKPFETEDLRIAVEMALYKWRMVKILKDEEKWFSRTLWGIGVPVIVTDKNGLISFMNPAAESLTESNLEDSIGEPIISVFNITSKKTGEQIEYPFVKMISEGFNGELKDIIEIRTKDGAKRFLERNLSPLKNELGNLIGSSMVLRNVTEEKQKETELKTSLENLERQLRQQNTELMQSEKRASLGFLVAGVAHEINDPLAYVKSNTEFVRDGISDLKKSLRGENIEIGNIKQMRRILNKNLQGIDRIAAVTKTLQRFAKSDSGEKVATDINSEIEEIVLILEGQLRGRVILNKKYGKLPKIMGNSEQLGQVFMTIIMNTSQSIGKGEIWINSWSDNGYIYIEIAGSERGPHMEDMEGLFDPFLATQGGNSRLNLDLCYRIIKEHHGEIKVENKVGKGTKFTIKLPI